MKKVLLFIILFTIGKIAAAQTDTSLLYLKFPTVVPFSIIKVPDSTKFTKADLKKKRPVLIMAFSPDCDHCQHETKELLKHIDLFKKVQIVMISPISYNYILEFYNKYELAKYPNITVGRDPVWLIGSFYNIRNYPGLFLYNKKGKFVKAFDGSVPVEKIAEAL
ncbi:peroxiredoxin family protein [Ferruginibacter sp. SUN002]|uniref:peroxiredoxin family protein n=1 Tax=Ferruginibacter sp. SUN002 TaxID=2937789 RepID=UPI003D35ADD9